MIENESENKKTSIEICNESVLNFMMIFWMTFHWLVVKITNIIETN
jgi:hypothetical protein